MYIFAVTNQTIDMMRKTVLMVLSILMVSATLAQDGEPNTISLTDAERAQVEQNSDFAFNLFRKTRGTESLVISPLSITYALGMLNNGAEGITREEICQVLSGGRQTDYADVATMNSFCRKMLTESALLDEDTRVAIANTIYFNGDRKDISLKTAFKEAAATYYDATPSILSFSDDATLGIINQWATDQTDGMIHDLLKPEDMQEPNLVSFLLNAICFKGTWVNQFEEWRTQNAYFDNMQRTAMMMNQVNEFRYAMTDLYQSVILPYGNGSYQMTLFLPNYGKTLDDLLEAMNGTNWNAAEYQDYQVWLSMPRIETDTNQDLNDIMASLGMPNAFMEYNGHGFWDFCYFGDNEDNSDPCWISMMRQKAHLKLDEKGTEAAAATVIGVVDNAVPSQFAEFIADRPFLYIISERSTGSIFFIGQYMGETLQNPRHDISLTDEERQLVKSNNDFAIRLFRQARNENSSIISPLSITFALGMLNNGAVGQTQQEINDVLGFGEAGADAINQFCRKMLTESSQLDKETRADIANNIYVNSHWGFELQEPFVQKANEYYDVQPESRDFYDGITRDVINQWGSDHTEGMIKEILTRDEFSEDAASYLLNALYFKGAWVTKFDPNNTQEEPFNGGADVPMMHIPRSEFLGGAEFDYTSNDLYQAIKLPYGNEAYLMTVILPQQDKTIDDVLGQMDGQNWQFNGYRTIVDLKLPRFETEASIDLRAIMSALGMPTAFNPKLAEFPGFGNQPTYIGLMKQNAKINVSEEGTEAAAITVIGVETSGMPDIADFHATRPFIYIISEKSTGIIFFIGQYMGNITMNIPQVEINTNAMENAAIYDLQGRKVGADQSSRLKKGIYIVDGKKVIIK